MAGAVDTHLREEQGGFRPGRSCTDQLNVVRMILEQCNEMQCEIFTLFVDFEKAFDRVKWSSIWRILKKRGIPEKIIGLIKCLYEGSSCRVMHKGRLTDPIPVTSGVKQGCLLSPLLFLIVLDDVMCRVTCKCQRGLPWSENKHLEDIDFADDLCLFSTSRSDLQSKTNDLATEAAKEGLRINIGKTKEMRLRSLDDQPLQINGVDVERVSKFTYLGGVVDPTGGTDLDIESRLNKARGAFAQLKPVWSSSVITRRTKVRIFESNVKSVLLYGCETWFVRKDLSSKLQVFVNKCLRRILRIYWPRTISNAELWRLTKQKPIDQEILIRKWRWLGHTLRRPGETPSKRILTWQPPGSRKRGRPKTTWRRSVESEAKVMRMEWEDLAAAAQDRVRWRNLLKALCPC
ncbi:hypothetical protein JYU34_013918 [Plutella xylostella]|uniref:Reverse transcriptase domain-containing protein n=1 Tax=Plutella xylostella TaxID=51655 RepID=A0ABQ7QC82_PLUXY|nr:hypothetical protein JYU34_013918 [Plutella xylostella]